MIPNFPATAKTSSHHESAARGKGRHWVSRGKMQVMSI
jgi:hypothetical protein